MKTNEPFTTQACHLTNVNFRSGAASQIFIIKKRGIKARLSQREHKMPHLTCLARSHCSAASELIIGSHHPSPRGIKSSSEGNN